MMLDQLWFSIRIIKNTLLESIPVAERFDAPAKMQNRARTGTRRFVTPSSTLRTAARPERKRSEGPIRADQFEFVAGGGRTPRLFSSGASRHARESNYRVTHGIRDRETKHTVLSVLVVRFQHVGISAVPS